MSKNLFLKLMLVKLKGEKYEILLSIIWITLCELARIYHCEYQYNNIEK